jgi:hypothetical protein
MHCSSWHIDIAEIGLLCGTSGLQPQVVRGKRMCRAKKLSWKSNSLRAHCGVTQDTVSHTWNPTILRAELPLRCECFHMESAIAGTAAAYLRTHPSTSFFSCHALELGHTGNERI